MSDPVTRGAAVEVLATTSSSALLVFGSAAALGVATGRLGANLDVVDPEPFPADHPLWGMPNVLLTPHMAGDARSTAHDLAALVAAQVEAYRTGQPLIDDVTDHLPRRAEHVS